MDASIPTCGNCSLVVVKLRGFVRQRAKPFFVIMRIKRLRLKNDYKRFHDLTIDLSNSPKRIVALVGPNGCGKSSVLDGILFKNNSHSQLGNKGRKDHNFHSMNGTPGFHHNSVELYFESETFEEAYQRVIEAGRGPTLISFRSSYRYNNNVKINEIRAVGEIRLNNYGASVSSDIDDKMEENYRRLQAKYNTVLNSENLRPTEAKERIIGELNESISRCLNLTIESLGNVEAGQGTIYFKKSDQSKEFEFNVLSSGEKEVVDILLDLYLRKDEYNDSVFLIDEPELHINTSIQRNLLVEINKLVGENCQIWVATHSVGFLRALQQDLRDDCQVIEFKPDTNWASEVITLTPIKPTRENWRSIFHTALDDLTSLIAPRQIIYCEGLDRPGRFGTERGFDARVFNKIFSEKYGDTIFVSSGGNTELDQRSEIALAILSKVFVDLEILVLKDRDISSGRLTTENKRQVYLKTNLENYRVLRRYEIENYLFDKDILKKYCAENSLEFDEDSYNAFVTDIVNQNLKDETNRIKNICGIDVNVNSERFKLNLSDYVTPDTAVYQDLEACIFSRDLQP